MTFNVKLYYVVQGRDGVADVRRTITLPFAPFVGLEVWFGDDLSNTVERVSWLYDEQSFVCEVDGDRDDDTPLAELIEYAGRAGFVLDREPTYA